MLNVDDSGAQAPSQGGWDGIDDDFLDDPLNMKSGKRSVAPPTPGMDSDRQNSAAPKRTLGQSLAGAEQPTQPSASTPSTTAPAEPAAPDPMAIARSAPRVALSRPATPDVPAPAMSSVLGDVDMSKLPSFTGSTAFQRGPEEAISRIPQPSMPANHAELVKREGELSKPLDPNATDPRTGKPMYRMSLGQRILGTFANAANGFARNGQPLVDVSSGATNSRYARESGLRQEELGGVEKQLERQQKDTEENRRMYEAATQQALREGQIERFQGQAAKYQNAIDPNSIMQKPDGTWSGTTYGGETREVGEPAWSQRITAKQQATENKIPTNEFSGWYQAFQRDNGRAPTAKDIQEHEIAKARAGKDTSATDLAKTIQIAEYKGRLTDKISAEQTAERARLRAEKDRQVASNPVLKAKYMADPSLIQKDYDAIDADLNTKYSKRLQDASDEADKMFGLTKAGKGMQSNKSAPASPPPAGGTSGTQVNTKPPKAGAELTDRNIARQYLQRAGGKGHEAEAEKLARADGWNVTHRGKKG